MEVLGRRPVIDRDNITRAHVARDSAEPFCDLKTNLGNLTFAKLNTTVLEIREETRRRARAWCTEQPFKVSIPAHGYIKLLQLTIMYCHPVNRKSIKEFI